MNVDSASMTQTGGVAAAKGSHSVAIAMVLLIVVAAAVYFLVLHPQQDTRYLATPQQNPALYGILQTTNQNVGPRLVGQIGDVVGSAQSLEVSYSGKVKIDIGSGGIGGGLENALIPQFPFTLAYEKYANDSRMSGNLTGIPLLGNVGTVFIVEGTSAAYACLSGNIVNLLTNGSFSKSNAYGCINATATNVPVNATLNNTVQRQLNFSLANLTRLIGTSSGLIINFKNVSMSEYENMPCYFANGIGVAANSSAEDLAQSSTGSTKNGGRFSFNACFSTQYNLPLTLNVSLANATSGQGIHISMVETSIGGNVTRSDVDAVPGPIIQLNLTNSTSG